MAIWEFEGKKPLIEKGTFVFPTADIIGKVTIGSNCYIGPGSVIRGDYGRILIGSGCSIQENVVIHARSNEETMIGNEVTLGHGCIIHNATLKDYSVVGMGAIVSDYAVLEEWAVLGEGGLARQGQKIQTGEIAVGIPAKVIGNIHDKIKIKEELALFKKKYIEMAARFLKTNTLKKIG
jgi:carbonic anhydrase/acetyltransferase-like protein (isoleucine patch superfamily)